MMNFTPLKKYFRTHFEQQFKPRNKPHRFQHDELETRVLLAAPTFTTTGDFYVNEDAVGGTVIGSVNATDTDQVPLVYFNFGTVTGTPAVMELTGFDDGTGDGISNQIYTPVTGNDNSFTLFNNGQPVAEGVITQLEIFTDPGGNSTADFTIQFTAAVGSDSTFFDEIISVSGGSGLMTASSGTFAHEGTLTGIGDSAVFTSTATGAFSGGPSTADFDFAVVASDEDESLFVFGQANIHPYSEINVGLGGVTSVTNMPNSAPFIVTGDQPVTYEVTGGLGAGLFEVDPFTGKITVAPDAFLLAEDVSFDLEITASDVGIPSESTTHTFTIFVNKADIVDDIAGRSGTSWQVSESLGNGNSQTTGDWETWNASAGWVDVQAADFTDDDLDDIVGRTSAGNWWVAENQGNGTFISTHYGSWAPSAGWVDVQVSDFNDDGLTDIAGRNASGNWWVAENQGNSTFINQLYVNWNSSAGWVDVNTGDFNSDGWMDIAGRTSTGNWWVAENQGNGTFINQHYGKWNPSAGWVDVNVGDFSADGLLDIIGRSSSGNWWVAENQGNGEFLNRNFGSWNPTSGWVDVQVADFNSDGLIDIAGRSSSGYWWVAENQGNGTSINQLWGNWDPAGGWVDVHTGDFNADGLSDIIGRNSAGQWYYAENQGNDTFQNALWASWSAGPWDNVVFGNFSEPAGPA